MAALQELAGRDRSRSAAEEFEKAGDAIQKHAKDECEIDLEA